MFTLNNCLLRPLSMKKKFILTIIVRCIDKLLEGVLVRDNKKAQI